MGDLTLERRKQRPLAKDVTSHATRTSRRKPKLPIDLSEMLSRIRQATASFPKAMLFELASDGFNRPFDQLLACLISIRTLDEVSLPLSQRLLEKARTPVELMALGVERVFEIIRDSTFARQKAERMIAMSRILIEQHDGRVPGEFTALTDLPGVGPKCANLVLGIAFHQPSIGVDIHVHRVVNRWGIVNAPKPEATLAELEKKVPERQWIELNELLMPFGKHICTGRLPKCSTCPVLDYCQQVGVHRHA